MDPPAAAPGAGRVEALFVAPDAEAPLRRVDSAQAVAGRGLEGDRYFDGRGTFSSPGGRGYELTLVDGDVLDSLGVAWERARRNVVTRGVSLNDLVGRRFAIGAVECIGRRLAEPCAHLERVSGEGLLRPLVHRAGLRADIVSSGSIAAGDDVTPLD
ncbi:MAG: MOSC domain-containing protein [Actinobacteria bacterium]|nr:MOSC domain-containing protein [Actinomycetota bacterium]